MPELALPEDYQGAEPTLQVVYLPTDMEVISPATFALFNRRDNYVYRPRYLTISGRGIAQTVGSLTMTFYGYQNGNIMLDVPAILDIPFDDPARSFTWSTEAGSAFSNFDSLLSGKSCVMPLPLVTMHGHVYLELDTGTAGGGDGEWVTDDGYLFVERYPPGTLRGAAFTGATYLLPAGV
jgi:hypothetical protein